MHAIRATSRNLYVHAPETRVAIESRPAEARVRTLDAI